MERANDKQMSESTSIAAEQHAHQRFGSISPPGSDRAADSLNAAIPQARTP